MELRNRTVGLRQQVQHRHHVVVLGILNARVLVLYVVSLV
jgi:hypothetical protein